MMPSASDVFFSIIDAYPERKKLRRGTPEARPTSLVVIRMHSVLSGQTPVIDHKFHIRYVDVRAWCTSMTVWWVFMRGLRRCDQVIERTRVALEAEKPWLALGAPIVATPAEDELQILGAGMTGSEVSMQNPDYWGLSDPNAVLRQFLGKKRLGAGLSFSDIDGASPAMMARLVGAGALALEEDEFNTVTYKLKPEALRFSLSYAVAGAVYDADFKKEAQKCVKGIRSLSKLELFFDLLEADFCPIDHADAIDGELRPDGQKNVVVSNLFKSRLYFEVLLRLEGVWRRGADCVSHHGPHSYYQCLLTLDDLSEVCALGDVSSMADKRFQELLGATPGRSSRESGLEVAPRSPWSSRWPRSPDGQRAWRRRFTSAAAASPS